jgi:isopropylmalate/homocitrate/citramalate synthase
MRVEICDVGPRDGLQNEPVVLEPAVRADLANRLARTGVARVEAASFVRDDLVPQMAGAEQVASALESAPNVTFAGLVLNERVRVAEWLEGVVGHVLPGRVYRAGRWL